MTTNNLQNELLAILGRHRTSGLYIGDHIPQDKLANAIAYFPIHRQETIVGLIDCTLFGSCKNGLAVTTNGIIWKNDWTTETSQTSLDWNELLAAENTIKAAGTNVTFSCGVHFNMAGSSMKPAEFVMLCLALIDFFSSKNIDSYSHQNSRFDTSPGTNLAGKIILISLFAKFAKSDGAITRMEIAFFEDFFNGLTDDAAEKKVYIAAFNKAKDNVTPLFELAQRIAEFPESAPDFIAGIYDALWQIALVDGFVSATKNEILKDIPVHLGLHRSVYMEAASHYLDRSSFNSQSDSSRYASSEKCLADYFHILGCAPGASDAELKMAYRRKISSLHPDKLQSKELADELLQFATQQVQKINHAYEEIMKYKNV